MTTAGDGREETINLQAIGRIPTLFLEANGAPIQHVFW
jgi:hypothetical protein